MLINMILPGAVETARLPKEYQEVEYIQSSGTQYIDTGFKPNQDTRVACYVSGYPSTASSQALFGSRTSGSSSDRYLVTATGSSYRSDFYNNNVNYDSSVNYSGMVIIDKNKNVTTIGDVTLANTSGTFNGAYSLFLFALNSGGSVAAYTSVYLYFCQIYDNGTLVRDFVPCYRKSDTAIGLYDIVNDVFYTNAGTGTFVKGADVSGGGSSGELVEFTYSGNYTDRRVNGRGVVRLNTSGTLTVTSGTATVSAYILAGGGGGIRVATSYAAGGGGGGNQIVTVELAPGTYEIVIGTGGEAGYSPKGGAASAGNGGNTSAFGIISIGGEGGYCSGNGTAKAGAAGSPNAGAGAVAAFGSGQTAAGGSPNGGSAVAGSSSSPGGDGYVELTFI